MRAILASLLSLLLSLSLANAQYVLTEAGYTMSICCTSNLGSVVPISFDFILLSGGPNPVTECANRCGNDPAIGLRISGNACICIPNEEEVSSIICQTPPSSFEVCVGQSNYEALYVKISPGGGSDPWLVGFHGQTYFFEGKNGKWYSLIHDDKNGENETVLNIEIAENKEKERETFISGVAVKVKDSDGNVYTFYVAVKDKEKLDHKCEREKACIGEGAVDVKVNDQEITEPGYYSLSPLENISLTVFNSPFDCKAVNHGHDNWSFVMSEKSILDERREKEGEREGEKASPKRRRLQSLLSFSPEQHALSLIYKNQYVYGIEKCDEWIAEREKKNDLFLQNGSKSTLFFTSPSLSLRLEFYINWDETWSNHQRFDLFINNFSPSHDGKLSGALGETSVLKMDEKGKPIMKDRDLVLSGKDEDYEVEHPFATDFKAKHF